MLDLLQSMNKHSHICNVHFSDGNLGVTEIKLAPVHYMGRIHGTDFVGTGHRDDSDEWERQVLPNGHDTYEQSSQ